MIQESLSLLAVFAHPDDESMGMGGVLAKLSAKGVQTHLICATRGERGWFGAEDQNPGLRGLGLIRTSELESAAKLLGLCSIHFLDYLDGEIDQAEPVQAIGKIAAHIRRIRPQVVVTFPPDGNYGHPDHIAIGQFAAASVVSAADAAFVDGEDRSPHRVSKFYFMVDSESFVNRLAPLLGEITFPMEDHVRGEVPWQEWMVTTRIEMRDYCQTAWRAILCHKSQLASLGPLADLEEPAAIEILAMQGTFYRVFSMVNGGRDIEDDLFEGIK
ncbi:MAG: PIG-L family deacetylase [Chloroflexi bacterium]|nr:PIG-L family deacetylase [Chloroflexota bacterium]